MKTLSRTCSFVFRSIPLAGLFLAAVLSTASAQTTLYWDGASNGAWSLASNWNTALDGSGSNPAAAPGALDTAYLTTTNTTGTRNIFFDSDASIGGITSNRLSGNNTVVRGNVAGAQTLSIGSGGFSGTGGVLTFGSATASQAMNIALTANQTWNLGNSVTVNNDISGNYVLTATNAAGFLILYGNNTFQELQSSSNIIVQSDNALNVSTVRLTSGQFMAYTAARTLNASQYILDGNVTLYSTNGNVRNLNLGTGAVTLTGNRSITVQTNGQGDTVTIGGAIGETTANSSLTKLQAGTLILGGNNTYTGATNVNAGTLLITGDSSAATGNVTVGNTGTLGGSGGTVGGAVTIQAGGILAIGPNPGTMTFTKNLTFNSGSTSNFEVNAFTPGNYDLALGGAGSQKVTFGGTINVAFQSGFNTTGSATIFDFETYAGEFSALNFTGLADGYSASFDKDTGTISVVPEPATWALLAFSLTTVMVLRRRK